ncbi:Metal-dependent hydrolase, endonuclease/exonuclease/phosphatase family [Algoriphagus faecimaris]|uniref:Metal-dependent hydrolase, endonuclease/exonuclease/phosphatase family n=1 Tax=Algoriphagus faecimaris TaxID=686796 RepID=A0A1G6PX81_9BACT|nr:endonuclease/exonuclease/phosphatase family protein [Algoriphagus faecimaris]SDC84802.1 Metal-dependent hydrolase, endonuclease/exonuclease/phosphatase family [Algoriphagus faecimaris]
MKYFIGFIFICTLLIFGSVYVSPEDFPYVGLLPFLIPVFWLLNLFLFFLLILSWKKEAFIPLLVLIIGFRFAEITFQKNTSEENPDGIKVLTYNTHLFDYKTRTEGKFDPSVYAWLQQHTADIKVFQEFYQDNTTPSRNSLKILGGDSEMEYSYQIIDGNPSRRSYGMAIFSKFPIINDGKIFDNNRANGAIFADILYQSDTIRIYNVHLESMQINSQTLENLDGVKENYRQTLGKLHRGSLARSKQLKVLEEHINNSPFPNIIMGDFNELPYSNTYFRLSKNHINAFETAGNGFEFTYNKILFFLRIDHIFSSPELEAVEFTTHREVDYSDHYPVSATLRFKK